MFHLYELISRALRTLDAEVFVPFASSISTDSDKVGILLMITIDPNATTNLFASLESLSYYEGEAESSFSPYTVFFESAQANKWIFRIFTECIKCDVKGSTGWGRLGYVLIKIGQPEKANELHTALRKEISDESDRGDYERALQYFETALKIRQEIFPFNHRSLAASYNNNIGQVHGST
ncbi:unnamed protein product [Adineta ricciae]|uniref:Uncharacterized protein n=1 Tax=Adineta ricciae TaxID=249248 RepID=A0A814WQY0_ADIRI|nr:unnamed protein product [Adineta ricciae]CAF1205057.1 unnamed protein product [Adineta ricciae]